MSTPIRLAIRGVRAFGPRRLALVAVGVAVGAACTPMAGPELRARVVDAVRRRRAGAEPTVEERVRRSLAESPRTWHLPQPEVVAVRAGDGADWTIILAGTAPDATACADLASVAGAVAGVGEVDNRIRITGREA
ncbi:MAG: BON domain-containing protein [Actinobacteria bacterium]|nr:BON domain-containing protein [Actinomycetota bacterium]